MKAPCRRSAAFWLGHGAAGLFFLAVALRGDPQPLGADDLVPEVVLPAPMQVVLYGGDRYLAANVEMTRAAASGASLDSAAGSFRLRTHNVVSRLNACHEDNYWIGNAALSWGGAWEYGLDLLGRATRCRFWDELPPFLYGFNQKFFRRDIGLARKAYEIAADRATDNAAAFRNMAIMLTVNAEKDARLALAMLERERDAVNDTNLRSMLDKRARRMAGLVTLRSAQKEYELRFGHPIRRPEDLLTSGLLEDFPLDPLGLGFEFVNGEFELGRVRIAGLD